VPLARKFSTANSQIWRGRAVLVVCAARKSPTAKGPRQRKPQDGGTKSSSGKGFGGSRPADNSKGSQFGDSIGGEDPLIYLFFPQKYNNNNKNNNNYMFPVRRPGVQKYKESLVT
jgi:hypothetical protein